jgi:alkyldihydroxyacetonephosphate synthase
VDDLASLVERLPDGAVSTHPGELTSRSRDAWPLAMLREVRGDRLPRPLAVVFPRATEDVAHTLEWATETRTAVVPRGAGSGVCGGAQAVWRGVVLDLSRMSRILEIDDESQTVRAEAGIRGDPLERALSERGLTLGHYPQSMAISSLGGWIAAASAGQASAGYGAIEDRLLGLTAVLGSGRVVQLPAAPRSATGPDLRRMFVGSEGTLAVVTEATLSVARRPESLRWLATAPSSFEAGTALVRELLQRRLHPVVVRVYDEVDAGMTFGPVGHGSGPVAIAAFEASRVGDAGLEEARRLALEAGAGPLGEDYGRHWWGHRNDAVVLYRRIMGDERMFGAGVIVDTMEVAAIWRHVPRLYDAVREALLEHASQAVGCHLSHPYASGASLYFTFLIRAEDDAAAERAYLEAWRRAAAACRGAEGTLSHHHGVGLLKAPFLVDALGPAAVSTLRSLKAAADPAGILNPGKLLETEP